MADKMSLDEIRQFWTRQAAQFGQAAAASWSDFRVMELEVRAIAKHLADGDRTLDVGCANGFSTVQFAALRNLTIKGVDYIAEMIAQANARLQALPADQRAGVSFAVGDIRKLAEPDDAYDKLVVIRVIINLGEWDAQRQALRECIRVLRPGGMLLLSEATLQGWNRLNALRREWSLPDIPMPSFNNYLDEERVIESVRPELELVALDNFASTYFVGTRVLKPLLAKLVPSVDVARPDMEFNRWFSQAPAWGDYGTQKLFVFRRR